MLDLNSMARICVAYVLLYFCLAGALGASPARAQAVTGENHLTVEEVVKLTRARFSEDIIITKIKKNGKAFDLSTDELLDLKRDGVSDNVIKYLLDPSLPYVPAAASPAASSAKPIESFKKYPADPYASRVPPEPAMYWFAANSMSKVDLKFLLGTEEAKSLMKKGKTIAYLIGGTSGTHLKIATPVFYVRLPEGKEIEELVLVSLTEKNGRRELDFGPKQGLKAEDTRPRDILEVGPRVYRVTPAKACAGRIPVLLYWFCRTTQRRVRKRVRLQHRSWRSAKK